MEGNIIQTDTFDFEDRIEEGIALVYFYDHMDIQCRGFEYIMEEVASELGEDVRVLSVDIEQSPELAYRYDVQTVPYVLLFKNGMAVDGAEGANLPSVYCDMAESYM